jgi:hypothetical protein
MLLLGMLTLGRHSPPTRTEEALRRARPDTSWLRGAHRWSICHVLVDSSRLHRIGTTTPDQPTDRRGPAMRSAWERRQQGRIYMPPSRSAVARQTFQHVRRSPAHDLLSDVACQGPRRADIISVCAYAFFFSLIFFRGPFGTVRSKKPEELCR